MENINEKICKCTMCGSLPKLTENSIQYGSTKFIIVGESPAKNGWIESKRAFYTPSGKLQGTGRVLEKLLNNIGLSVNNIYFTECCKCIIEDRSKLEECSNNCMPILIEQLNNIPCKIILTMGKHPTQAILQTKINKFADYVGKEFNISLGNKEYKLIPIYHPSPQNPKGYKNNVSIFNKIKENSIWLMSSLFIDCCVIELSYSHTSS